MIDVDHLRNRRLGMIGLLALLCSCVSTITPPKEVQDPVEVFLIREARHVGLVLPDFQGGFLEYAYGDWEWYALEENRWYDVFDTALWPTQGCLGVRRLPASDSGPVYPFAYLDPVTVERAAAERLLEDLTVSFEERRETWVFSPKYRFDFVHSDSNFWFGHNCSDAVAAWLEELECDVSWTPIRIGFESFMHE